jgi:hypothetical protein
VPEWSAVELWRGKGCGLTCWCIKSILKKAAELLSPVILSWWRRSAEGVGVKTVSSTLRHSNIKTTFGFDSHAIG